MFPPSLGNEWRHVVVGRKLYPLNSEPDRTSPVGQSQRVAALRRAPAFLRIPGTGPAKRKSGAWGGGEGIVSASYQRPRAMKLALRRRVKLSMWKLACSGR